MAKFSEQMQAIFDRYTEEVDSSPVSLDNVAAWAIEQGLYRPQPRDVVKLCREALAESLRQEKRIDAQGRKYRAKHSVRTNICLLYTSPSPRDKRQSRMPSSA